MSIFRNRTQQQRMQRYYESNEEENQEPRLFTPHEDWKGQEEPYPETDNIHQHPNWQQHQQRSSRGPRHHVSDMHPRELSFWREERLYDDYQRPGRQTSPIRFVLILASLVIIAIFGWLVFRWVSAPQGGMPPLLVAEPGPYKVRPDHPGGMQVPYQDRLVYNRLSPDMKQPPEQLLPGPEQPMTPPQQQYQQQPQPQQQYQYPQAGYAQPQPVYQHPQQPMQQGQMQHPPQAQGMAYPQQPPMTPDPTYNTQQAQAYQVPAHQPYAQQAVPPVPQAMPAAQPQRANALPQAQPETTIDDIVEDELNPAKKRNSAKMLKEADAKKIKEAKVVFPAKSYRIQVATLASKTLAEKEMARVQRAYSDLVGTLKAAVQKVEGAGEIYRILFGPFSRREDAIKRCGKFRANGFSCIVLNPAA